MPDDHGPWEQYAKPQGPEQGPWTKYAQPQGVPTGEISARTPDNWERIENAIPALGHLADIVHGRINPMASMRPQDVGQLAYPERVFTPSEQAAHPIRTGADEFIGGLTSPDNLLLMQGLGAAGALGNKAFGLLPRIASAVFTGQMGKGTYDAATNAHQLWQMYKKTGDDRYKAEAYRVGTHAVLGGVMTMLSAHHAAFGDAAPMEKGQAAPVDAPVAASGKTESEAKVGAPSSPQTGSSSKPRLSYDQLKERIATIEKRIADEKAAAKAGTPGQPPAKPMTETEAVERGIARPSGPTPESRATSDEAFKKNFPPETMKEPSPLEKDMWQQSVFGQKPQEDIGSKVRQANPEPTRAEVKAAAGPSYDEMKQKIAALESQKAKEAAAPEQPAPPRETPTLIEAGPSLPERVTRAFQRYHDGGMNGSEIKQQLIKDFPEQAALILKGFEAPIPDKGATVSSRLEVKQEAMKARQVKEKLREQSETTPRLAAPAESAQPAAKPLEATGASEGPREPVRPAERPEVEASRQVTHPELSVYKPAIERMRDVENYGDAGAVSRGHSRENVQKARALLAAIEQAPKQDLGTLYRGYTPPKGKEFVAGDILNLPFSSFSRDAETAKLHGELQLQVEGPAQVFNAFEHSQLPQEQEVFSKGQFRIKSVDGNVVRVEHVSPFRESDLAARLKDLAKPARDTSILGQVQKEHPDWTPSQQLMEAAKRANPPKTETGKPLDFTKRLELVRQRVEAMQQDPKYKGVAKTRLQEIASEEIKKQQGSLSFRRLTDEERAAANPLHRLADVLDRVAGFFEHPVQSLTGLTDEEALRQQHAKNIMREEMAKLARTHLEAMNALDDAIKRHDNPVNERDNFLQFMDAGEGKPGAQFLNPQDQALAEELHNMFKERWEAVKDVKGLEGDGIENYLAHIWEKPEKAQKVLRGLLTGKRPLQGSARFLRERFYQYASSGIDHGLAPATWNPIRLQLAALFDTDRFLMAHEIKDRFKDAGLVRWTKVSEYGKVPDGWQRLDDKIFAPKMMDEGGLKEFGQYHAPPEVARIFNNHLAPGLAKNPVFRAVRNYNNALNMYQLGISGYHGTMISLVSATSDLALGLQKMFNVGDFKGGIRDALRGSVGTFMLRSAAADYKLGRSIQSEAIEPTGNPVLQSYVDLLMKGGGRFKQDAWYTQGLYERKGFVNWLRLAKQGKFFEMATAPVRTFGAPIMEKFVPRVKLGVAARMMESKLDFMLKQGVDDPNSIATELGKIWDSVDNRAGQMVYDNLFWNRATKDLSFLAVRAVGWDLGSFREYGGAVLSDLPRQAAKALRGQRPELTARMAFTIATPITIGLFGGMVHYMMTGKAPQKPEDYFFPGPEGDKVSFPSYMKDFYAFKQHPMRTIVNKLSPTWTQVSDLYSDSDFYGTEIYHPGDPLLKKGWDVLKWYASNWEGFSFKGIQQRVMRGEAIGPAGVTGMFGFQPASPYVSLTNAGELASDLASREWKRGPRTSADAERYQLVQKFERQVGDHGKVDMNELTQAWKDKKIQDSDLTRIYGSYNTPKIQRDFKVLTLPDALAVMREATPDERVQLKPLLLEKYNQLDKYPIEAQQAYDKQLRQYLQ